jgi:hypothetical protein
MLIVVFVLSVLYFVYLVNKRFSHLFMIDMSIMF